MSRRSLLVRTLRSVKRIFLLSRLISIQATDAHYTHTLALGALIEESEPVEGESVAKEAILEKLAEKAAGLQVTDAHEFREDDLS